MVALCAGSELTILLGDSKAFYTLLRCTILVKLNQGLSAVLVHDGGDIVEILL
jgi:hypothetical protein